MGKSVAPQIKNTLRFCAYLVAQLAVKLRSGGMADALLLVDATHDVQHRAGRDRVRSPVTQRRVQVAQIGFVEKRDEK